MVDGFYKIDNVFTEEQRQKLLSDFKPFLLDAKQQSAWNLDVPEYPEGFDWFKISFPTLHLVPQFKELHENVLNLIKKECGLNLKIAKSWVNLSNGKRKKVQYHTHPDGPEYSCVYYIKTFPFFSNGTLFKDYGLIRAKQNSLMIFDPNLEHSTPSSPLPFERYTWAMDLNTKKIDE